MTWPPATHQDVEDDLTNGHGWAGSLSERFGMGEQLVAAGLGWVANNYYSSAVNAAVEALTAVTPSRLYMTPIYFPIARSVNQIAINVTSAGTAGHVARLGIYNASTSTGLPSTVKLDAGTVAVDSTGSKQLTISTTLSGLFWLAITAQSGTMTGIAQQGCAPVVGTTSVSASLSNYLKRESTSPTSALPNLTGDATVLGSAVTTPRVLLRAA